MQETFESSLGSGRMTFKRTNYAYESFCQFWYQRVYRAFGVSSKPLFFQQITI